MPHLSFDRIRLRPAVPMVILGSGSALSPEKKKVQTMKLQDIDRVTLGKSKQGEFRTYVRLRTGHRFSFYPDSDKDKAKLPHKRWKKLSDEKIFKAEDRKFADLVRRKIMALDLLVDME